MQRYCCLSVSLFSFVPLVNWRLTLLMPCTHATPYKTAPTSTTRLAYYGLTASVTKLCGCLLQSHDVMPHVHYSPRSAMCQHAITPLCIPSLTDAQKLRHTKSCCSNISVQKKLSPVHAIQAYGRGKVHRHSLASEIDGGEWWLCTPLPLYAWYRTPVPIGQESGWVPQPVLKFWTKIRYHLVRDSNPGPFQP
jgi:hypothetical protein